MAIASRIAPPTHLLAGGNWRQRKTPDPLLVQAIASAGVKRPRVAYLGAASGDDAGFFQWTHDLLLAAGAGSVTLARTAAEDARSQDAKRMLRAADLVYVSGGDVEEGMRVLAARGLVAELQELHARGTCFCGMSAGSIMLARAWVRWTDPDDDATAAPFACLGIAPVLCDTHAEGDDWIELHALLAHMAEGEKGYGIPSGWAIAVEAGGGVTALGGPVPRFARRGDAVRKLADLSPHPATGTAAPLHPAGRSG